MISRLRGELLEMDGGTAVIDAGGVGYDALLPESVAVRMPKIGERVDLLVRQVIREDSITLYGFLEPFQRKVFDLLLEVKGCGPKVSLALIGQLGEDAVAGAIVGQDVKSLSRASGVGPRLAERIIVELKDKMAHEQFGRRVAAATAGAVEGSSDDQVIDALIALGYRRAEAENAARGARDESPSVEGQLRAALRSLQS